MKVIMENHQKIMNNDSIHYFLGEWKYVGDIIKILDLYTVDDLHLLIIAGTLSKECQKDIQPYLVDRLMNTLF